LLLFPHSWRQISLYQNSVSVIERGGSGCFGLVAGKTIVSPYFVVLNVKLEGLRQLVSGITFPDAMGAGESREFCFRLKFA
jgi:hypothetical protein